MSIICGSLFCRSLCPFYPKKDGLCQRQLVTRRRGLGLAALVLRLGPGPGDAAPAAVPKAPCGAAPGGSAPGGEGGEEVLGFFKEIAEKNMFYACFFFGNRFFFKVFWGITTAHILHLAHFESRPPKALAFHGP